MTSEIIKLASSPIGARRLGLITAINDNVIRAGFQVSTEQFEQTHEDYLQDWHVLQGDLKWMGEQGWIEFVEALSGIDGVLIQSDGVDAAMAFRSAIGDVAERVRAARENYLRWLYECEHSESARLSNDDFRANRLGHYLGRGFTDAEIRKVAQRLVEGGFMTGERMATGAYTGPRITNEGIDIIERYGSLANTPASPQGNVTTHISLADSHGSNISVGSSNVTQSSNVTVEQLERVQKFIASARGLVPLVEVSPENEAAALQIIGELESEATSRAPKSGRIKELINKVTDIAVLGTAQGMVDALVGMAETTMTAIGG